MAAFDAKRLSRLDWLVVGAGAVALVSLFLPWFGASGSVGGITISSSSLSGWSTSYGWLGAVLVVAAGVFLAMVRSQVDVSRFPLTPAVAVLAAASVGTVVVILRWITLPRAHVGVAGVGGYDYGPRVGIWLTIIAGVVQVAAAVALFRQSGEELPFATRPAPGDEPPST